MKRVILLSVSILLICLAYSFAEVPCKINYQGRLIKDNVPVDGTKTMVFSIYDSAVGPTLLWTSGDVSVEVHNGLFRYVIGSGGTDLSGMDWTAGQALYLEVIVDGETLTPREELSAYPYAINSHLLEGEAKEYFLNTSAGAQTKQGNLNIMGNLGIGTTGPTAKLHVGGTAGTDGIMFPDGTLQTTAGGVPVGSIMPYAGSSAPSGWLLCNGSTLTQGGSGQIYEALYDVIGTTYGGTGANDFKLPDLRGRAAIGAGTGVGLSPRTLADEIGEENHQLTINEMPSHTHLLLTNEYRDTNTNIIPGSNDYIAQRGQGSPFVNYGEYDIAKGSGISPSVGKARETGGGATHNNMQPSLVFNFIIKY